MKLTKCMVLVGMLCMQLERLEAANNEINNVKIVNKSAYQYKVIMKRGPEDVFTGNTNAEITELDFRANDMVSYANLPDGLTIRMEPKPLISWWTAAVIVGARIKEKTIYMDDVSNFDSTKEEITLMVSTVQTSDISFKRSLLEK